ncbi:MAG: pyridoxine 5'-phosphate synthase [Elusimicrobia bacterium]|nr:pyridoxine 5'-phosphate synthase [Elusimicrobiota bacterium]
MALTSHVKLGVNIDHIATLRQARQESEPDPVAAARVCKTAGADMIVCHLRKDRRHIQDADLAALCALKGETHLELCDDPEMVAVALKAKPSSVCLVPETAREVTTRGGLDLLSDQKDPRLENAIKKLKKAGIEVSLFVDPDPVSVRRAKALGADTVELCTTAYAVTREKNKQLAELETLALAGYLAHELGLSLHAGHALDYHNARGVARLPHMACLNIGFSIVARSVFVGLKAAVAEMKQTIS